MDKIDIYLKGLTPEMLMQAYNTVSAKGIQEPQVIYFSKSQYDLFEDLITNDLVKKQVEAIKTELDEIINS
jgi:hypothetical protein